MLTAVHLVSWMAETKVEMKVALMEKTKAAHLVSLKEMRMVVR